MGEVMDGYQGTKFEVELKRAPADFFRYIRDSGIFEAIRKTAKIISEQGWAPQNAGNISYRAKEGHDGFYITASGSNFSDIELADITYVSYIEMIVGKDKLYIGSNFGINSDITHFRLMQSMHKQGILKYILDYFNKDIPDLPFKAFETGDIPDIKTMYPEIFALHDKKERYIEDFKDMMEAHEIGLTDLTQYLTKNNLLKIIVHGTAPGGEKPSSEAPMHQLFYTRQYHDPNATAIVHCHEPSITDSPSSIVPETETPNEKIGYGTIELAIEAAEELYKNDVVVLQGHGPVVVSHDDLWLRTGYATINCLSERGLMEMIYNKVLYKLEIIKNKSEDDKEKGRQRDLDNKGLIKQQRDIERLEKKALYLAKQESREVDEVWKELYTEYLKQ